MNLLRRYVDSEMLCKNYERFILVSIMFNKKLRLVDTRQFDKDKKIIIRIIFLFFLCAILFTLIFPSAFEITSYFVVYILLGLAIFVMAPKWLSTMTLFYIFYTISVGCGEFFIWREKLTFGYSCFAVVLGGLMAAVMGYGFSLRKITVRHLHIKKYGIYIRLPWIWLLYLSYAFATLACIYYFYKNHSLLFNNLNDGRIAALSGNGMIFYILKLHMMIVPFMYEEYKKKKIKPSIFWLLALLAGIQLLVTGFRTPVMSMVAVMIIIDIYQGRTSLKKAMPVVTIAMVAAILYGTVRNGSDASSLYKIGRGQLFVGLQNLNYVFNAFPNKCSFQHGYTYLINLIMLKPGPDLDYTLWLKQVLGMNFSGGGVTPTILGEFYMNFGYMGIFIGMFLFGVIVAFIDKWLVCGDISFWKAYVMLQVSSCCGGGIANIYINLLVLGLYYLVVLRVRDPRRLEASIAKKL